MKREEEQLTIGKDEMNLVEFPITLLAKRHEEGARTLKFSDTIPGEGNKPVKREWLVTGSDEFGLPLAQDNDVLLALLTLGKEKNFKSRTIHFSRYKLCEIMGWQLGGSKYRRIEEALDRLSGVRIKAKNAFWDNAKKGYTTKNFGIIDDYELLDSSKSGLPGQETFPFSYVNLGEVLFESIQSGYIKSLDMNIYFGLESAVTKRLYRYLDKKAYDSKKKFEINLFVLAEIHLGLHKTKYASHIKEKLNPAHEELIKAGYLKSAEYRKTSDGASEKVVYTFARQDLCEHDDSGKDVGLMEELLKVGVTRKVAEQMIREYSLDVIGEQMEALPYRNAEDAPAVLVASIMGEWAMPAALREKWQRRIEEENERDSRGQEKRKKMEHRARIEAYLSSLGEEEREALSGYAAELARQEGGALFRGREIPEYMVTGYLHGLVEKELAREECRYEHGGGE